MKIIVHACVIAASLTLSGLARADTSPASPATFFVNHPSAPPPVGQIAHAIAGGPIVRASWYGGGERLNRRTSTGEIFHPLGRTAAHRTLPLGTIIRVSALATGRSTIVRINDRGPAAATGRALDLSRGAALDLGLVNAGDMRVTYEIVH